MEEEWINKKFKEIIELDKKKSEIRKKMDKEFEFLMEYLHGKVITIFSNGRKRLHGLVMYGIFYGIKDGFLIVKPKKPYKCLEEFDFHSRFNPLDFPEDWEIRDIRQPTKQELKRNYWFRLDFCEQ
jgi:hypothetical protein